jgi:hypothetical protein
MKKIIVLLITVASFTLSGCAELQQVAASLPQNGGLLTNADIAAGLKQALDKRYKHTGNKTYTDRWIL